MCNNNKQSVRWRWTHPMKKKTYQTAQWSYTQLSTTKHPHKQEFLAVPPSIKSIKINLKVQCKRKKINPSIAHQARKQVVRVYNPQYTREEYNQHPGKEKKNMIATGSIPRQKHKNWNNHHIAFHVSSHCPAASLNFYWPSAPWLHPPWQSLHLKRIFHEFGRWKGISSKHPVCESAPLSKQKWGLFFTWMDLVFPSYCSLKSIIQCFYDFFFFSTTQG